MTSERIIARIEGLRGRRDEAVALAHSLDGAIQDCEYWLTVLAEDDNAAHAEENAAPPIGGQDAAAGGDD